MLRRGCGKVGILLSTERRPNLPHKAWQVQSKQPDSYVLDECEHVTPAFVNADILFR